MKEETALRLAAPGTYENVLEREGQPPLFLSLRWPRLEETAPGLRRVNRYYDALADRWRRRWEGPYPDRTGEAPTDSGAPWRFTLDHTVTYWGDGLFSLYLDAVEETGRRRPARFRQGDTWRLPQGVPVTLRELLPRRRWWRAPVLSEVRRQIGGQISAGEAVYFDDWLRRVSQKFSPGRFYLTEAGPAVFYPVGSLAPAMEGFPTFSLAELQDSMERTKSEAVKI